MSDLPAVRRDGSSPLPLVRRAAENVGDAVADGLDWLGAAGIAEHARNNVIMVGVTFFGFFALAIFVFIVMVFGEFATSNIADHNDAAIAMPESGAPAAAAIDPLTLGPGEEFYPIVRNDTLGAIAQAKNVSLDALRGRNVVLLNEWRKACEEATTRDPSTCVDTIRRGKKLVIPAKP